MACTKEGYVYNPSDNMIKENKLDFNYSITTTAKRNTNSDKIKE